MSTFDLGIKLLVGGSGLIFVVFLIVRLIPRFQKKQPALPVITSTTFTNNSKDAVFLIQSGGRIVYANEVAQKWFGYHTALPNLERLTHRIRPADVFLGLCANEGQARFTIDQSPVEASSFEIPSAALALKGGEMLHAEKFVLVTMRHPQESDNEGGEIVYDQALEIFNELNQKLTASFELEKTLYAILEGVERLIPADYYEITRWDAANSVLIPYRFMGAGLDRRLEVVADGYSSDKGYSGYLISKRQPLLIPDVDAYREVRPSIDRKQYPFYSFIGIPIQIAGMLLGTIELASLTRSAFSQKDVNILRIVIGPASIALNNALLYQAEQKRILEISGLANIARLVGNVKDTSELIENLVNGIRPLLAVKTLGFLLYDSSQRILEAQIPFLGIPTQMLEFYKVSIPADSPAEKVLFEQRNLIATDAANDPELTSLGLNHMALAAGIQQTVLIPLTVSGRILGYLQVGDKIDGSPFDGSDIMLLDIVSSQSAAIIDNAVLMQESDNLTRRSDVVELITTMATSTATFNEMLSISLAEIAKYLDAEIAMIYLLEEPLSVLRIHKESAIGLNLQESKDKDSLLISELDYQQTVSSSKKALLISESNSVDALAPIYKKMIQTLKMESLISVPIVVRNQGIGEVMFGGYAPDRFDQRDLDLTVNISHHLANAIEKHGLYKQTDEGLRKRIVQLLALNRINREVNATVDLQRVLKVVYDEVCQISQADCGTILLLDRHNGSGPRVSFSLGDANRAALSDLEKNVLNTATPRIIEDFDNAKDPSVDQPPHDHVRSALIVPITFEENSAGLICLHGLAPGLFDNTTLEIVQSLASQATIAIGNAQRYQEQILQAEMLNRRVDTMTNLLETSRSLQAGQPLGESLESIAYAIQSATPFEIILISVYCPQEGVLERVAGAGIPLAVFEELKSRKQSWSSIEPLLQPEFRLGNSFLIPYDRSALVQRVDIHTVQILPSIDDSATSFDAWHPDDLFIMPLYGSDGQTVGLISVDGPRNGLRPDRPTVESLEIFASQAALVIENYNQITLLRNQSKELQIKFEQISLAAQNSQAHLPVLLRKDLEQTLEIRELARRNRSVVSTLKIIEIIKRQESRLDVLQVLAEQIKTIMDWAVVLIAEFGEGAPRLANISGELPDGVNPQALLGQRNPLRVTLQTGQSIFVPDLEDDKEWKNSPLLIALEARSFFCFPILSDSSKKNGSTREIEASVLSVSNSPVSQLSSEDEQIYRLLADQVNFVLQNLRVVENSKRNLLELNMLLEFGRQLGTPDTGKILHTLVESSLEVISGAHAGMVALWSNEAGILVPQYAIGYGDNKKILEINYHPGEALPGQVFETGEPVRLSEVIFAEHYKMSSTSILIYRDATGGRLPVSCLVVPISTQDHQFGVLVLDNFKLPGAFTEDDQALIMSLVRQTALTLENLRLYQSAEARAVQLQGLTSVAGTITSSLKVDELTSSLLDHVRTIIPFDAGILWLRHGDQLNVRAASGFVDSEQRVGLSVKIAESLLLQEMTTTGKPLSVPDVRLDERFPSLVESQHLSWLGAPLLTKGEVTGVLVLEKSEANFYLSDHVQAMVTFAGQASVALENARLYEDSLRRAQELDQRSKRLALLNRLSSALSESLDLEKVLTIAGIELAQAVPADIVSIVIFDKAGRPIVQSEHPQHTETLPELLPDGDIFNRLRQTLGVFSTDDISVEPELEHLDDYLSRLGTHALLILPLVSGNNLLGLVMIHSTKLHRYSPEESELGLTVANQVAVAMQNARLFTESERLFSEMQQRSTELSTLFELGVNLTLARDERRLLDLTFENIAKLLMPDAALVALVQDENTLDIFVYEAGARQPATRVSRQGTSFSEYVIQSSRPLLIGDTHQQDKPVGGVKLGDQSCSCWLGVPLIVRGSTIGVLSIQSYTVHKFGESHLRLVSQIANQLSVALDNTQLFQQVQTYAADLEERVNERTEQVAREHRRIQTLLSITTELSASLDLDMVLDRTLVVINETIGSEHSTILLSQMDSSLLYLRAVQGYVLEIPKGGKQSALKRTEGLAGWILNNRQAVLIDDLWADGRWDRRQDVTNFHRSAMAVPLLVGEDILGVLLCYHRQVGAFMPDQLELLQATAKQIAVAINNAQLYGLIRDQAEHLGDMLRTQHIETSRSQAILEAVADGVLVTDSHRQITLFNASAEQILGLKRTDILGKSLENFIGLFGNAGQTWFDTIQAWSKDSTAYRPGKIFAAQIELDNRRVVAVHLSPVRLRNDFLGTVSIFRDITHEVEVDRLKSEFVATVSHELRTPMTSIKGYVEIMLMGAAGQLSEQQTHFLQVVKSNTERLAILVNDLLDVSRIEAGKVSLSKQALDLRTIADEVINLITRRMQEEHRSFTLIRDIPGDLAQVYGDHERVLQIMDNLVENAYQYTYPEGTITVRMRQKGQQIQVDVQDTGIGIKPEERDKVFERFYRGDDPLVYASSGNGLGLSIVKKMVEMHKGQIWCESSGIPGLGSTFSFTLPIYNPENLKEME